MTTLLLVRHAATPWTQERRLQGRTDIDLSDAGRADAAALRPLVAAWAPATLISSPLARTRSTAALLSDLDPTLDPRWMESSLGDWEGRLPAELGADYTAWRAGRLVPPGGEDADAVRTRIVAAVTAAAARPGPVLVVTHGGTIRAVLAHYLGLTADLIEPVAAPSLTAVDVDGRGARLRAFNAGAARPVPAA
ncbi:histidine phosphatase family protein [Serinibacter arcticus]|uniref:Histidine phosphatase family protein n=1 Tax=Serinibacter arcticus TaxID=1655435 RepID=A0A2U1ZTE2_9MICO|nr:histidine phosphatase family protein [Serinibacter arcticus]PWD50255.1 histidine phosphatase family protein [Serinibacter arcticus]